MSNQNLIVKLNTDTQYIIDNNKIVVKNSINDVSPIRITQLIDVNASSLEDGAILVYNSNTNLFETVLLSEFVNLTVSNTITLTTISANGTIGSNGQILVSNGTSVYWADQVELPDEIDGGFY